MRILTILLAAAIVLGAVGGPMASVAAGADVALTVTVKTAAGGSVGGADLHVSWDGGSTTATTASNGKAFVDVPEGVDVTIEVEHPFYIRNEPYEVTDAAEQEVEVTVWEKATASVTVVDRNGPVEDAHVLFRKQGAIVANQRTDAQGTVDSGVIESGDYTVSVRKAGYLRQVEPLLIQGDIDEEIRIERGSVSVEFNVLDDTFDPSEPVEGATITGSDFSTVTQPDGSRTVSLPVNTELTVSIEKEGYQPVQRLIVVREADRQINFVTRRNPAVQVELSNERVVVGETLQVTVTDEYDEPLPDATVYLDGTAVGQPDSTGTLQIPIESAGEHTLFAQVDQLSSDQRSVTGVGPNDGSEMNLGTPAGDTRVSGFLALPAVGALHLRSLAIGGAGGLLLAVILFVYFRFG